MAYEYVLINIIDIDVFVNNSILEYVLRTPLVNSVIYNLYKLNPFPTKVKNSKDTFVFIGSEKDYLLCHDKTNVDYVKFSELEVSKCKIISPEWLRVNRYFL